MTRRIDLPPVVIGAALGILLAPAAFAQGVGSPAAAPEAAISTPSSQHPDLSPQDDQNFNRGIAADAVAPAAPAAHDMNMQSGSTGPATTGVLAHVDKSSIAKEPKQTTKEMTATALLNRFSTLGFAGVREFRRDGDHYVAEAQSMDGKWVNVTIDPVSGDVRANGPVG